MKTNVSCNSLDAIAHNISLKLIKEISLNSREVKSEISHKFEYVLNSVIKNLKNNI